MNIPFQTIHFMVYEFWQEILNPAHKYDPKSHLIAGGLAGGLAAAATTPLDCIKTVLNTQQTPEAEVTGDKRIFIKVTHLFFLNECDVVNIIFLLTIYCRLPAVIEGLLMQLEQYTHKEG